MDTEQFDGKVALVTGASMGIGRATALAYARRGADVVICDIDAEAGNRTADEIRDLDVESTFVQTDVSDADDVDALFEVIDDEYGRLDFACNNAGIEGEQAKTGDCSLENWSNTIGVNLDGAFYCLKHELRRMNAAGSGSVVNVSSVAGINGFANLPAYVASKHGLVGLTKSAALDYADAGIRVNAVCPGVIDTPMIERTTGKDPEVEKQYIAMEPVGRLGTADEIANAVIWLSSDEASFVTGAAMAVDGGFLAR